MAGPNLLLAPNHQVAPTAPAPAASSGRWMGCVASLTVGWFYRSDTWPTAAFSTPLTTTNDSSASCPYRPFHQSETILLAPLFPPDGQTSESSKQMPQRCLGLRTACPPWNSVPGRAFSSGLSSSTPVTGPESSDSQSTDSITSTGDREVSPVIRVWGLLIHGLVTECKPELSAQGLHKHLLVYQGPLARKYAFLSGSSGCNLIIVNFQDHTKPNRPQDCRSPEKLPSDV